MWERKIKVSKAKKRPMRGNTVRQPKRPKVILVLHAAIRMVVLIPILLEEFGESQSR